MKRSLFFLFLTLTVGLGVALSAQWFEKKTYVEWSAKEVNRMLDESPWTKVQTVTISKSTASTTRTFESTGAGDLQREMQNHFRTRLLTAMPIRMAIARNLMLKNPKMMDAGRLAGLERFVRQSDDQNIIVLMSLSSTPAGSVSVRDYWTSLQNLRTPNLTANTFLATSGGKRVYLVHYEPPGNAGGSPDFGEGPGLTTRQDRIWTVCKLQKMVFEGKLEI